MDTKILITGDYCPIGRNQNNIKEGDYTSIFGGFTEIIRNMDFAITNLESPITTHNVPIVKSGPNIKGSVDAVKPLKEVGFNLVTLANNHILDYGEKGVADTIAFCNNEGIATVGAGSTINNARKIFVKEIKGKKFAFINLAENEFCAATEKTYGANPLDLIKNQKDIVEAKKQADFVIVIAHGGREHYQLPTPLLRERYRFFIDSGADVVVGHHTHCYSGYETYKNKKIFYSLGNFIFDYKQKYQKGLWTEGMAVILKFSEEDVKFELIPFFQGRRKNHLLQLMDQEHKDNFLMKIKSLNEIITNDLLFFEAWNKYINSQIKNYKSSLFINNRYIQALMARGVFPFLNFRSKKRKALLLNLYRCETHKEIMIEVLKKEIEE